MSEKEQDTQQADGINQPARNTRLILLIMLVIAIIVLIIRNIDVSKNILMVLLGFGAVIVVHEFGHFVVAKLCRIKVEAFSIGFPPVLIGIKKADRGWRVRILPGLLQNEKKESDDGLLSFTIGKKILPGETEYMIGLIPFGGFVKMLGQEDVGPVKTNDDPRSYANKPALARAAVLAAGVSFNVISAVIVYIIVFLIGINLAAPIVGGVVAGSPAAKAGIRPGDEVIEIAGNSSRLDFSDIVMEAVLSDENEPVPLKVRHLDGTSDDVTLIAEQFPGAKMRAFGIERPFSLKIAQVPPKDASHLFAMTGLKPGDNIKAVDGVDVNYSWQVAPIIENVFEANVPITALRTETAGQQNIIKGHLPLSFMPSNDLREESEANLANICGIVPQLRIANIAEGPRPLKKMFRDLFSRLFGKNREKLKAGDIIIGLDDVNYPTFSEMREITIRYENKNLPVTVLRKDDKGNEKRLVLTVTPWRDTETEPARVVLGILPELNTQETAAAATIATEQYPNPAAIPRGARITAIDGVEVSNFYEIADQLKRNSQQRVTIDWRLDDQKAGNTIIEVGDTRGIVRAFPAQKEMLPLKDMENLYKADGPIDAIKMGYKKTKTFIVQTYITLYQLIGGLLSPKQLMGPVGILTFSYKIVAAQPFVYYLYFLGLISASIAVLNFLPLPPFDGGLTVLLIIEKIKGSPLSMKTQEAIAYVAWGMILMLMLYVTYNDILRLIFGF